MQQDIIIQGVVFRLHTNPLGASLLYPYPSYGNAWLKDSADPSSSGGGVSAAVLQNYQYALANPLGWWGTRRGWSAMLIGPGVLDRIPLVVVKRGLVESPTVKSVLPPLFYALLMLYLAVRGFAEGATTGGDLAAAVAEINVQL